MPWIQDHLLPVIELLPIRIEPEDEVPNFHRLKLRIGLIERQHFILSMQAWVEDNATWLALRGLRIQSGRSTIFDGEQALAFFQSHEEDILHTGNDKPTHDEQIDLLLKLLDLHGCPPHQTFVEMTVEDLNSVRWHPTRVREVLSFKIADAVPDAYAWLGRHSAARQAIALARLTPLPPRGPGRPRL